jgi:hypothetical protein
VSIQAPSARSGAPVGGEGTGAHQAARRWLVVAAWVAASLVLFGLFLRISLSSDVNSDGANNALQGWDLLHGHLLLHGWDIGDANFYFFELPLNALTAAVLGLGNLAAHAASALAYLFVAMLAVLLAVRDSSGPARVVRCAVAVMVLAGPVLTGPSLRLVLEEPDHIGTSVFVLGSLLLADLMARQRAGLLGGSEGSSPPEPAAAYRSSRRSAVIALLVCVILTAGQFSDMTVRYVAVPAVVLVCGYRALAARRLRSPDAALAAAAVASVPLAVALSSVFQLLGGFTSDAPRGHLAPVWQWRHGAWLTWINLRNMFGAVHEGASTRLGALAFVFGSVCLAAAILGLLWVVYRWPRASRADQMLCVAILCNVGVDMVSTLARVGAAHELAVVLPCGAVLAARLVPARITRAPVAFAAIALAGLAAVLPLAAAATASPVTPLTAPITAWLEAHGLSYGIGGYWVASSATVQSGGRVQVRTINLGVTRQGRPEINGSRYEINNSWYDPSLHDATFVIADPGEGFPVAAFERAFGKPSRIHHVQSWIILVYQKNLLALLGRPGARVPASVNSSE